VKLTLTTEELAKVSQHWAQYQEGFSNQEHWTGIPAVKSRINRKTTGNPDIDLFAYVIHEYFLSQGRGLENCLSLGSGNGDLEIGLTQYTLPKKHVGIEISEVLVEVARKRAAAYPHIEYRQGDLNTCDFETSAYDLVIAHQSLHHVSNLEALFDRVKHAMKPGALFIFDEYVGPRRFQWTDRQLECINGVIQILPPNLNKDVRSGIPAQPVSRCTPEQVARIDPSEAIRSDEIVPLAEKVFRILEFRPYGGTLLHMLLHMRAGNFLAAEATPWLDLLFELEDLLLPELGSDFAAAICSLNV
jgi:O-antigen biosynthesis protein